MQRSSTAFIWIRVSVVCPLQASLHLRGSLPQPHNRYAWSCRECVSDSSSVQQRSGAPLLRRGSAAMPPAPQALAANFGRVVTCRIAGYWSVLP
jgi:hypothetical protein